jgi:hypothetical protein
VNTAALEARISDIHFCRRCTLAAVEKWKGWPIRDAVPLVPMLKDSACPACGGCDEIASTDIGWLNIHGPYSSGLPDYWVLLLADPARGFLKKLPSKWGLPYYELLQCPACGGNLFSSLFVPGLAWQIRRWCPSCGKDETTEGRWEG